MCFEFRHIAQNTKEIFVQYVLTFGIFVLYCRYKATKGRIYMTDREYYALEMDLIHTIESIFDLNPNRGICPGFLI